MSLKDVVDGLTGSGAADAESARAAMIDKLRHARQSFEADRHGGPGGLPARDRLEAQQVDLHGVGHLLRELVALPLGHRVLTHRRSSSPRGPVPG